jgi:hypothetical protein
MTTLRTAGSGRSPSLSSVLTDPGAWGHDLRRQWGAIFNGVVIKPVPYPDTRTLHTHPRVCILTMRLHNHDDAGADSAA